MLKLCAGVSLILKLETQILSYLPQSSKDVERPLLASLRLKGKSFGLNFREELCWQVE